MTRFRKKPVEIDAEALRQASTSRPGGSSSDLHHRINALLARLDGIGNKDETA